MKNLGEPIETNMDTHAIMKMQEEGDSKEINILLDGYFYKTDDMIKNGTSMMGVVCRQGTNFCVAYMSAAVVVARLKLNEVNLPPDDCLMEILIENLN